MKIRLPSLNISLQYLSILIFFCGSIASLCDTAAWQANKKKDSSPIEKTKTFKNIPRISLYSPEIQELECEGNSALDYAKFDQACNLWQRILNKDLTTKEITNSILTRDLNNEAISLMLFSREQKDNKKRFEMLSSAEICLKTAYKESLKNDSLAIQNLAVLYNLYMLANFKNKYEDAENILALAHKKRLALNPELRNGILP